MNVFIQYLAHFPVYVDKVFVKNFSNKKFFKNVYILISKIQAE